MVRPESYTSSGTHQTHQNSQVGLSGLGKGSHHHGESFPLIQGSRSHLYRPDHLCHRWDRHYDHFVQISDIWNETNTSADLTANHHGTTTCYATAEESRTRELRNLPPASLLYPNHWAGKCHQSQPDTALHWKLYCSLSLRPGDEHHLPAQQGPESF